MGHKEVVNFLKYIYLLLLIAYSDLKEADTDCYSQWQKKKNRTAEPPACDHDMKWKNNWNIKTDPEPLSC